MHGRWLGRLLVFLITFQIVAPAKAAGDSDAIGPPVDGGQSNRARPSSPPNPCVMFENWDVGGNAIRERVFVSDPGARAMLQYATSEEHQVFQFASGVRVKAGERYRLTGSVAVGDESDREFRVFFEKSSLKAGTQFEKRVMPGRAVKLNEEISVAYDHLNLYIYTKPSTPRDMHISVDGLKICHVK